MAVPDKIYKFRSLHGDSFKFTQDIFVNQRIYLSKIAEFNDPNEANYFITLEPDNPYSGWANTGHYANMLSKVGVYSLTEENLNVLMWSHYAAGHTGICIEFDSSKGSRLFSKIEKVKYTDVDPLLKREYGKIEIDLLKEVCNYKYHDWNYENEWRIITDGAQKYLHFEKEEIAGVVMGHRISPEDKEWVKYWISSYPNIKLYQASLKQFNSQLTLLPL